MSSERVFIIAGKRSAVAPRSGAFASLKYYQLAAQVVIDTLKEAKIDNSEVDELIVSNALGAGGNPARMVSLEACLLYTSPSPRDMRRSRMPSSA